ncbi:MAG TPA: allantoicase [Thermoanaerobaculia bacterium]
MNPESEIDFTELVDLASDRIGGTAIAANDEFFAPCENLVKAARPVWREGEYTDRGKWMDGWETRRRREPGHDWCILRLGLAGQIAGVIVDTAHFVGNHPEACSIEVASLDGSPDRTLPEAMKWTEILPRTALRGDAENRFAARSRERATYVRLNIYPDGGVARLRVYGFVIPDLEALRSSKTDVDLASMANGGRVVAASDMFFGSRHNLILPDAPRGMSDGWETRRRRGPGNDWAILRLGARGRLGRVEVDTTHFKGNAPGSCSIEVLDAADAVDPSAQGLSWSEFLPKTKLGPHRVHTFERELRAIGDATHARLQIYPDGGVARLRLFGRLSGAGR